MAASDVDDFDFCSVDDDDDAFSFCDIQPPKCKVLNLRYFSSPFLAFSLLLLPDHGLSQALCRGSSAFRASSVT